MRSPRSLLQWSAALVLASAGLFGSSSVIALQDAAALAEIDAGAVPRWRMHFLAAPAPVAQPASLDSFDLAWTDREATDMPGVIAGRGFTIGSEIVERPRQVANDRTKASRLASVHRAADPKLVLAKLDRPGIDDGATPAMSSMSALRAAMSASATTPSGILNVTLAEPPAPVPVHEGIIGGVSVASREPDSSGQVVTAVRPRPVASAETMAKERKCMAEAIYFEARGEPELGQYAVAQVVMNRVRSGYYPDDVCGVVYENKNLHNRCQFSFACDGIPDRITNKEAWNRAVEIAKETVDTDYFLPEVGSATHYHATYVHPYWTWDMDKLQKIGKHIFYRDLRWGSDEG
jgi:hypothetical protein